MTPITDRSDEFFIIEKSSGVSEVKTTKRRDGKIENTIYLSDIMDLPAMLRKTMAHAYIKLLRVYDKAKSDNDNIINILNISLDEFIMLCIYKDRVQEINAKSILVYLAQKEKLYSVPWPKRIQQLYAAFSILWNIKRLGDTD